MQSEGNRPKKPFLEEETQRQQEILSRILDSIPLAVFWKDLDGVYRGCNQRFVELAGLESTFSIIGKTDYDLPWADSEADGYRAVDEEVLRTGKPKRGIIERLPDSIGREIWVETTKTPLFDSSSKPYAVLGVFDDITERKEAELKLQENYAFFKAVFDHANIGKVLTSPNGRIERVNRKFADMLGYTPEEIAKKSFLEITHPDDLGPSKECVRCLLASEVEDYEMEKRYLRKDGGQVWALVNTVLLRDHEDMPLRFITTIQDITERKEAELALVKSEKRFKRALENIPAVVVIYDTDLRIQYVNESTTGVTGRTSESYLGKRDDEIWPPEVYEEWLPSLREVLRSGRPQEVEARIALARDNIRDLKIACIPVLDDDGRVAEILGITHDETDKRKMEEQLRTAMKMEAVGRLAGGVAHDFNNLLTVINSYSDMALDAMGADDPRRRDLRAILDAGSRASALTRQLLAFSRRQILEPEVLNLNGIVGGLGTMLGRLLGETIRLETHLAADLGNAVVDAGQVEQIIMNLAINAKDAMPTGGKLTLETLNVDLDGAYAEKRGFVAPGRYVCLSVSDNGEGMDSETLSHIFEPFFTTKEKGKGTGLGLATVYGIVKQSGGHILVYSEPGTGSAFKIYFPLVESALTAEVPRTVPRMAGGNERILVAEDEDIVRDLVERILSSVGFQVTTTTNGLEAMELFEASPDAFDLLLTDVIMPDLGGRDLAERLTGIKPDLKVLFMSGYTDNAIVHHGVFDEGINFLAKPFNSAELTAKVRSVLDSND